MPDLGPIFILYLNFARKIKSFDRQALKPDGEL